MFHVYFLKTCSGRCKTYIGFTVDLDRRLKQHNGLLTGGAKATRGRTWERVCHVRGFVSEKAALQFEWAWKYYSRKLPGHPLKKRLDGLFALLNSDKVTSLAEPLGDVEVVWESELDPFTFDSFA
jgi:structure-specific endonuclease subunit SLX1